MTVKVGSPVIESPLEICTSLKPNENATADDISSCKLSFETSQVGFGFRRRVRVRKVLFSDMKVDGSGDLELIG